MTTSDNRSFDLADGLGTTEICVFCHTPHHGIKSGSAPLWNKALGATGYTGYGTLDTGQEHPLGTGLPTTGSSLACLACHDGTRAFDNMINAPGKGTWTSADGWTSAVGTPAIPDPDAGFGNMEFMFSEDGNAGGNTHSDSTTSRHNLARGGLGNDHPINLDYRGQTGVLGGGTGDDMIAGAVASLRNSTTQISLVDLNTDVAGLPLVCDTADPSPAGCNAWAVNGFIKSDATINDILKVGKIECISCHDPHYRNQTNPEIDVTYGADHSTDFTMNDVDGLFLRRVGGNSDSGVCRTCHAK
jgi:hypothetical protein